MWRGGRKRLGRGREQEGGPCQCDEQAELSLLSVERGQGSEFWSDDVSRCCFLDDVSEWSQVAVPGGNLESQEPKHMERGFSHFAGEAA